MSGHIYNDYGSNHQKENIKYDYNKRKEKYTNLSLDETSHHKKKSYSNLHNGALTERNDNV